MKRISLLATDVQPECYQDAMPFPHAVFYDTLPWADCQTINDQNPLDDSWNRWGYPPTDVEGYKSGKDSHLEGMAAEVMEDLNSPSMMQWLGRLTGIKDLFPDPGFIGGGLHAVSSGGYLEIHADFNRTKVTGIDMYRRLNLLLYLNPSWDQEWGGHLELWDRTMKHCVRRVAPLAGTMVIFTTSDHSFHGHPHALMCPVNRTRRSLALYYYTVADPDDATRDHSTLFQKRGGEA